MKTEEEISELAEDASMKWSVEKVNINNYKTFILVEVFADGYKAGYSAASSIQEAALREAIEGLKEAAEVIRIRVEWHFMRNGHSELEAKRMARHDAPYLKASSIINKYTSHE